MFSARPAAIGAILIAGAILSSCTRHSPVNVAAAEPASREFDDIARFLAGLKGHEKTAFADLEQSGAWRSYASEFDSTWADITARQFNRVDEFQKRELAPVKTQSDYVFYPFSGPDVIYAMHFFPSAKTFVFAGLERVGNLKPRAAYKPEMLDREFQGWRTALNSILTRSFFVTSEMDRHFHGTVADGLLPLILLLLARNDCWIDDVRYGLLNAEGEFLKEEPGVQRHAAVEIRFRRYPDPTPRRLFYFSTDLAKKFVDDPSFANFLKKQGRPDTLVKSASFLLHWQMCAGIRAFIVEQSNLILEDDTGVPYRYFQQPEWEVSLFGEYSRPDRPFRKEYQPDLAEAFQDPARVRELGFAVGYGYQRRPSSLILARRVTAATSLKKQTSSY